MKAFSTVAGSFNEKVRGFIGSVQRFGLSWVVPGDTLRKRELVGEFRWQITIIFWWPIRWPERGWISLRTTLRSSNGCNGWAEKLNVVAVKMGV